MSLWTNWLKRRAKRDLNESKLRDISLCNGSTITARVVVEIYADWNNENTKSIEYLKDKFVVLIGIYRQQSGTYTAQQSIQNIAIFISTDEIREAIESIPQLNEVHHFGDLDSATQWILQGELIRSESLAALFNEGIENHRSS